LSGQAKGHADVAEIIDNAAENIPRGFHPGSLRMFKKTDCPSLRRRITSPGRATIAATAGHMHTSLESVMYVNHREMSVTLRPLKLILSIAAGIWLGFLAVLLSLWLIYKMLPVEQTQALNNAAAQMTAPPAAKPKPESDAPMFDQYRQILRDSEARQTQEAEQAERQRSFNGPKCQFWMQQNQTAPSEKSRASVYQFCG
jgi:hypothetical protein